MLIHLNARGEEIDVRFERGLKGLIPVHDVREDGQRGRSQPITSRPENVSNSAFVYENPHLRIANGKLAAVLDFTILHGVAVGKNAVLGFYPLNDINKLLGNE